MVVTGTRVRPLLEVVEELTPCVRNAMACYVAELELALPEVEASPCADLVADPAATLLLGSVDGHPISLGAVRVEDQAARVTHLWVRPAMRRAGWGSQVLVELEALAVQRGARSVEAHAHEGMAGAHQLLLRSGYREAGRVARPAGEVPYLKPLSA